jgi:hypothetical protein
LTIADLRVRTAASCSIVRLVGGVSCEPQYGKDEHEIGANVAVRIAQDAGRHQILPDGVEQPQDARHDHGQTTWITVIIPAAIARSFIVLLPIPDEWRAPSWKTV